MKSKKKKSQNDVTRDDIFHFFAQPTPRPLTLNDFLNAFSIYDEQDVLFVQLMIEELEEKGKLREVGRGRYAANLQPTPSNDLVIGRVDFVNPRFAFIRHEEGQPDIYIEADDLHEAWHGDTVEVKIIPNRKRRGGDNPEGRVIRILERAPQTLVGRVKVFPNYGLFRSDSRTIHQEIFIAKGNLAGVEPDDIALVEVLTFPEGPKQASGRVVDILGKKGQNDAEMHAILAEFGLPIRFPEEVEAAAQAISEHISEEEIQRRRDFRSVLTFTIDPHDAKDFDDAISFQLLENGHFEVGVHIADVTHYVKEDSIIEQEAFRRATSVYLVDRTIPMLPEKLSNNLCSLRPHEDKLVFSAVFTMDDSGKVIDEWFGRAIIHSDHRFAYEEAQEVIEGVYSDEAIQEKYGPVLTQLNTFAHILREKRFKKGAFNFESPEVKFRLDDQGRPTGIYTKVRKDAHKLIEEFMLLANKQVAEFVYFQHFLPKSKRPKKAEAGEQAPTMVYRIHEPPNPEKVEIFARFAGKLGYTVKTQSNDVLSKSLNALVQKIEGTPIQNVLESLAIRTMSKAKYSTQTIGHFGLAFAHYSHFTSPIRRYPDMMAHRLLHRYLHGYAVPGKLEIETQCKHSSEREKMAADAERASIKYKQVEYMTYQDEDVVYTGVITGVTDFGIFVEMNDTNCEGMIRLADLSDDYYSLDQDNYRIIGQATGKIYTFGDAIQVKVKQADLASRSIDLVLADASRSSHARRGGHGGGRRDTRRSKPARPKKTSTKSSRRKKR